MRPALLALLFLGTPAVAEYTVHYIANAGVLVVDDETKILFDPFAANDYGRYFLPPEAIKDALFAGVAPFDGIDAVFISHVHADHYSAGDLLQLLRRQPHLHLFAPEQVASDLRGAVDQENVAVLDRIHAIAVSGERLTTSLQQERILVEAAAIPHSGWPDRMTDIENVAFRITLNERVTITHLGDADVLDGHFARRADFWQDRATDLALPPYWFFLSTDGRTIIAEHLLAAASIGIHVPKDIPENRAARPDGLRDVDLFTRPGQTRRLVAD